MRPPFRSIALFKPYDVLCQFTDMDGRMTLKELVPIAGIYPVGRLDRDSEGLLLLTDDGSLAHRLTDPRFEHPKTYLVQVERIPGPEALESLRRGVILKDGPTRPAQVELATEPVGLADRSVPIRFRKNVPTAWLRLTIREGRNRQVRRMTAAVGHPTLRLVRIAVGPVSLGDLASGQWRDLNAEELAALDKIRAPRKGRPLDHTGEVGRPSKNKSQVASFARRFISPSSVNWSTLKGGAPRIDGLDRLVGFAQGVNSAAVAAGTSRTRRIDAMSSAPLTIADAGPLMRLLFEGGTLVVDGIAADEDPNLPGVKFDNRTRQFRAEAIWYRTIVEQLVRLKQPYTDTARAYEKAPWRIQVGKEAFPHQIEGLNAWWQAGGRGVVVLPTGTGKTHLANMAIERAGRPTLIVTPTIDLMNQWFDELTLSFGIEIGLLGGGYYDIQPLTVTTYDSAYLNMERLGNRFGLIVFDECHHLPGPTYGMAATCAIAPYRLGLTATPERADNAHTHTDQLIGPIVYRREITQLRGDYLAEYNAMILYVQLNDDDRQRYEQAREIYRGFVQQAGINMSRPNAWGQFIFLAHRSPEGREAFRAYREQRELALAAPAKLNLLARLLERHNGDRVLIFTHDNATVYKIARQFLVPVITHQTKTKERREILLKFNAGTYPIVATSRVLNEGVNVPEANVAIILSGSGSVREHVQRLGRILRKSGDKEATLYEVITRGTAEEYTSNRRRQHDAYDGKNDPSDGN